MILLLSLSACSKINPLGFLSSGANTAANVQVGKTNTQTVGTTNNQEVKGDRAKVSGETKVQADTVKEIVVQERDNFLLLILIICFIAWSYFLYLLPSPEQLWRKRK